LQQLKTRKWLKKEDALPSSTPLIAVDELSALSKTKDVKSFMEAVHVWDDVLKAKRP
jgi:hypothetical protein